MYVGAAGVSGEVGSVVATFALATPPTDRHAVNLRAREPTQIQAHASSTVTGLQFPLPTRET
jgi:hypothetical protein